MNKYRLKKDLPFAKAGEEVTIESGEPITIYKNGTDYTCSYFGKEELIEEGWIEKVKVREVENE